jgi:choline kinase
MQIQTLYNPLYQTTEGLISPWIQRGEMNEYIVVLNRDYLFEVDVLERARGMRDEKICVTVKR